MRFQGITYEEFEPVGSNRGKIKPIYTSNEVLNLSQDYANRLKPNVNPFSDNLSDEIAEGQSNTEKIGKSLVKGVATIGEILATGNPYALGYGVLSMITDQRLSAFYDNNYTRTISHLKGIVDDELRVYKTQEEEENPFKGDFGSITGNVIEGLSFSLGTLASLAKGNPLGTTKLINILKGSSKFSLADDAVRIGTQSIDDIAKEGAKKSFKQFVGEIGGNLSATNALTQFIPASVEAGMEATDAANSFEEQRLYELRSQYENNIPQEELDKLEKQKELSKNLVYGINLPIVLGSNFLMFSKFLKSSKGRQKVLEEGAEAFKKRNKSGFGAKYIKGAEGLYETRKISKLESLAKSGYEIGKTSLSEGSQEYLQSVTKDAVNENVVDYVDENSAYPYVKAILEVGRASIDKKNLTDPNKQFEALLGAVVGTTMFGLQSVILRGDRKKEAKDLEEFINFYNSNHKENKKLKSLGLAYLNYVRAKRENDSEVSEDILNKSTLDVFDAYIDTGNVEDIKTEIKKLKELNTEEEVQEIFGEESGINLEQKERIVKEAENSLNEYLKIKVNINKKFSNASSELKNALAKSLYKNTELQEKIDTLRNDITSIAQNTPLVKPEYNKLVEYLNEDIYSGEKGEDTSEDKTTRKEYLRLVREFAKENPEQFELIDKLEEINYLLGKKTRIVGIYKGISENQDSFENILNEIKRHNKEAIEIMASESLITEMYDSALKDAGYIFEEKDKETLKKEEEDFQKKLEDDSVEPEDLIKNDRSFAFKIGDKKYTAIRAYKDFEEVLDEDGNIKDEEIKLGEFYIETPDGRQKIDAALLHKNKAKIVKKSDKIEEDLKTINRKIGYETEAALQEILKELEENQKDLTRNINRANTVIKNISGFLLLLNDIINNKSISSILYNSNIKRAKDKYEAINEVFSDTLNIDLSKLSEEEFNKLSKIKKLALLYRLVYQETESEENMQEGFFILLDNASDRSKKNRDYTEMLYLVEEVEKYIKEAETSINNGEDKLNTINNLLEDLNKFDITTSIKVKDLISKLNNLNLFNQNNTDKVNKKEKDLAQKNLKEIFDIFNELLDASNINENTKDRVENLFTELSSLLDLETYTEAQVKEMSLIIDKFYSYNEELMEDLGYNMNNLISSNKKALRNNSKLIKEFESSKKELTKLKKKVQYTKALLAVGEFINEEQGKRFFTKEDSITTNAAITTILKDQFDVPEELINKPFIKAIRGMLNDYKNAPEDAKYIELTHLSDALAATEERIQTIEENLNNNFKEYKQAIELKNRQDYIVNTLSKSLKQVRKSAYIDYYVENLGTESNKYNVINDEVTGGYKLGFEEVAEADTYNRNVVNDVEKTIERKTKLETVKIGNIEVELPVMSEKFRVSGTSHFNYRNKLKVTNNGTPTHTFVMKPSYEIIEGVRTPTGIVMEIYTLNSSGNPDKRVMTNNKGDYILVNENSEESKDFDRFLSEGKEKEYKGNYPPLFYLPNLETEKVKIKSKKIRYRLAQKTEWYVEVKKELEKQGMTPSQVIDTIADRLGKMMKNNAETLRKNIYENFNKGNLVHFPIQGSNLGHPVEEKRKDNKLQRKHILTTLGKNPSDISSVDIVIAKEGIDGTYITVNGENIPAKGLLKGKAYAVEKTKSGYATPIRLFTRKLKDNEVKVIIKLLYAAFTNNNIIVKEVEGKSLSFNIIGTKGNDGILSRMIYFGDYRLANKSQKYHLIPKISKNGIEYYNPITEKIDFIDANNLEYIDENHPFYQAIALHSLNISANQLYNYNAAYYQPVLNNNNDITFLKHSSYKAFVLKGKKDPLTGMNDAPLTTNIISRFKNPKDPSKGMTKDVNNKSIPPIINIYYTFKSDFKEIAEKNVLKGIIKPVTIGKTIQKEENEELPKFKTESGKLSFSFNEEVKNPDTELKEKEDTTETSTEEETELTPEDIEKANEDNDVFAVKELDNTIKISKQEAIKWLKEKLGEDLDVSNLEDLHGKLTQLGKIIVNEGSESFVFHEAFHKVFRSLSKKTQNIIITQRRVYRTFKQDYEAMQSLYPDKTENEIIEEILSEDFRSYMLQEDNYKIPVKQKSIFKVIWEAIKEFFGFITINDLFEKIQEGKFKDNLKNFGEEKEARKLLSIPIGGVNKPLLQIEIKTLVSPLETSIAKLLATKYLEGDNNFLSSYNKGSIDDKKELIDLVKSDYINSVQEKLNKIKITEASANLSNRLLTRKYIILKQTIEELNKDDIFFNKLVNLALKNIKNKIGSFSIKEIKEEISLYDKYVKNNESLERNSFNNDEVEEDEVNPDNTQIVLDGQEKVNSNFIDVRSQNYKLKRATIVKLVKYYLIDEISNENIVNINKITDKLFIEIFSKEPRTVIEVIDFLSEYRTNNEDLNTAIEKLRNILQDARTIVISDISSEQAKENALYLLKALFQSYNNHYTNYVNVTYKDGQVGVSYMDGTGVRESIKKEFSAKFSNFILDNNNTTLKESFRTNDFWKGIGLSDKTINSQTDSINILRELLEERIKEGKPLNLFNTEVSTDRELALIQNLVSSEMKERRLEDAFSLTSSGKKLYRSLPTSKINEIVKKINKTFRLINEESDKSTIVNTMPHTLKKAWAYGSSTLNNILENKKGLEIQLNDLFEGIFEKSGLESDQFYGLKDIIVRMSLLKGIKNKDSVQNNNEFIPIFRAGDRSRENIINANFYEFTDIKENYEYLVNHFIAEVLHSKLMNTEELTIGNTGNKEKNFIYTDINLSKNKDILPIFDLILSNIPSLQKEIKDYIKNGNFIVNTSDTENIIDKYKTEIQNIKRIINKYNTAAKPDIKNNIETLINSEVEQIFNTFRQSQVDYEIKNLKDEDFKGLIKEAVSKYITGTLEMSKILGLNPLQYDNFEKRISTANSSGQKMMLDETVLNYLASKPTISNKFKKRNTEQTAQRLSKTSYIVLEEPIYNIEKDELNKEFITKAEKEINNIVDSYIAVGAVKEQNKETVKRKFLNSINYTNIKGADSNSHATLDWFRTYLFAHNVWDINGVFEELYTLENKFMEYALDYMENNNQSSYIEMMKIKNMTSSISTNWGVAKTTMSGRVFSSLDKNMYQENTEAVFKTLIFPLIPSQTYGTKKWDLMLYMYKNDIDIIGHSSGIRAGYSKFHNLDNIKNNGESELMWGETEDFLLQQDFKNQYPEKVRVSYQFHKVQLGALYYKGKSIDKELESLVIKQEDAYIKLLESSIEKALNDLGFKSQSLDKYVLDNKNKLVNIILNSNFGELTTKEEDDINILLKQKDLFIDSISTGEQLEKLIVSKAIKSLTNINISGGQFIAESSFLESTPDSSNDFLELEFYSKHDYMEVVTGLPPKLEPILNNWFSGDINDLNEYIKQLKEGNIEEKFNDFHNLNGEAFDKIITYYGHRTPYQQHASGDKIRIHSFKNKSFGHRMIVPPGFVNKTDADFDGDKINVLTIPYEIVNDVIVLTVEDNNLDDIFRKRAKEYVEAQIELISNPLVQGLMKSSIDVEGIDKVYNNILPIIEKNQNKVKSKFLGNKFSKPFSLIGQTKTKEKSLAVVPLISIVAKNQTLINFLQRANIGLKYENYVLEGNIEKDFLQLGELFNKENTLIFNLNSTILSNIIDAIKNDNKLAQLNINEQTLNVYLLMQAAGTGFEASALFLNQPIIRDFVEERHNSINKSEVKSYTKILKEYGFKVGNIKNKEELLKIVTDLKSKEVFTKKELFKGLSSSKDSEQLKYLAEYILLNDKAVSMYKLNSNISGDTQSDISLLDVYNGINLHNDFFSEKNDFENLNALFNNNYIRVHYNSKNKVFSALRPLFIKYQDYYMQLMADNSKFISANIGSKKFKVLQRINYQIKSNLITALLYKTLNLNKDVVRLFDNYDTSLLKQIEDFDEKHGLGISNKFSLQKAANSNSYNEVVGRFTDEENFDDDFYYSILDSVLEVSKYLKSELFPYSPNITYLESSYFLKDNKTYKVFKAKNKDQLPTKHFLLDKQLSKGILYATEIKDSEVNKEYNQVMNFLRDLTIASIALGNQTKKLNSIEKIIPARLYYELISPVLNTLKNVNISINDYGASVQFFRRLPIEDKNEYKEEELIDNNMFLVNVSQFGTMQKYLLSKNERKLINNPQILNKEGQIYISLDSPYKLEQENINNITETILTKKEIKDILNSIKEASLSFKENKESKLFYNELNPEVKYKRVTDTEEKTEIREDISIAGRATESLLQAAIKKYSGNMLQATYDAQVITNQSLFDSKNINNSLSILEKQAKEFVIYMQNKGYEYIDSSTRLFSDKIRKGEYGTTGEYDLLFLDIKNKKGIIVDVKSTRKVQQNSLFEKKYKNQINDYSTMIRDIFPDFTFDTGIIYYVVIESNEEGKLTAIKDAKRVQFKTQLPLIIQSNERIIKAKEVIEEIEEPIVVESKKEAISTIKEPNKKEKQLDFVKVYNAINKGRKSINKKNLTVFDLKKEYEIILNSSISIEDFIEQKINCN